MIGAADRVVSHHARTALLGCRYPSWSRAPDLAHDESPGPGDGFQCLPLVLLLLALTGLFGLAVVTHLFFLLVVFFVGNRRQIQTETGWCLRSYLSLNFAVAAVERMGCA